MQSITELRRCHRSACPGSSVFRFMFQRKETKLNWVMQTESQLVQWTKTTFNKKCNYPMRKGVNLSLCQPSVFTQWQLMFIFITLSWSCWSSCPKPLMYVVLDQQRVSVPLETAFWTKHQLQTSLGLLQRTEHLLFKRHGIQLNESKWAQAAVKWSQRVQMNGTRRKYLTKARICLY